MEIWKIIQGFESKYEVSNTGKIRSLNYKQQKGFIKELQPCITNKGYYALPLCKQGKQKTFTIHRIVAETFLELPENFDKIRYTVNHKDGNKLNNHLSNLEWMTYSENNKHAYEFLGKISTFQGKCFEKSKLSKRIIAYSDDLSFVKSYNSTSEAQFKDKYHSSGISTAIKYNKKYKNLNWEYV